MEVPIYNKDLKSICDSVITVAGTAGCFIRDHFGSVVSTDVRDKDVNSLVSYVDIEAEKLIVEGLKPLLCGATFFTEEHSKPQQASDLCWIIDPLDGTTNFLHGVPIFAISIALLKKKEVVLGVILDVMNNNVYSAIRQKGAFLNNKPIGVTTIRTLDQSIIATGFPYSKFEQLPAFLNTLSSFIKQTRGVRRMGAAAIDLCYVARGIFDGFYEFNLSPWDVAAGALIVSEAGGRVTTFFGDNDFVFGRSIIASNKHLHNLMLAEVQQQFSVIH